MKKQDTIDLVLEKSFEMAQEFYTRQEDNTDTDAFRLAWRNARIRTSNDLSQVALGAIVKGFEEAADDYDCNDDTPSAQWKAFDSAFWDWWIDNVEEFDELND